MKRLWLGIFVITAISAGCNRGGGITAVPGGLPSSSTPSEVSSSAQVVKVTTSGVQVARNSSAEAIVTLAISPGFHVNANPATFPYLIPTEITAGKLDGITAGQPAYPAAEKRQFQFADEALAVYEGNAQIKMSLRADQTAVAGARTLPITLRVQACDHEKCYPPANLNANIPVEVK